MKTFQRIGRGINTRVLQKMKHLWQSMINESHGALQVFMSDGGMRKRTNISMIGIKPLLIALNERISLGDISNSTKLGKKCPQLSASFGFRIGPQPAHPFMLDMIQTALSMFVLSPHLCLERAL